MLTEDDCPLVSKLLETSNSYELLIEIVRCPLLYLAFHIMASALRELHKSEPKEGSPNVKGTKLSRNKFSSLEY